MAGQPTISDREVSVRTIEFIRAKSRLSRLPMKFILSFASALVFVCFPADATVKISQKGNAVCVLVQQGGATTTESNAVKDLAHTLHEITGANFATTNEVSDKQAAIIVGPGALAQKYFPEVDLAKFGSEELTIKTKGNKLLLAGGRPRGTMYAVNRFLQEQCGVRWWTAWATNLPQNASLKIGNLDVREQPAFEYRGPYWYPAFEPHWRAHNCANNESWMIPEDLGGCIYYKGFCHTFYPLVSPEKNFKEHPEWFSLVKGKRTHDNAQLCLTNPDLRKYMVQRVKEWLRESPGAKIVSVTQNDCFGFCECPNCKAIDDAEGSHAGTMIDFVNYVAEQIEPEFPNVLVDTFAYQYTRHAPKHIKPRHNVCVRLCSIECNFREPFTDKSNADFLADLQAWSKICEHLYVWDYTTDFSHYCYPHPNWFVMGEDARIFKANNVKGFFSEGAYAGHGHEMAELRAWVLAQLMWNPNQDDKKLIREFLDGYYGKAAGKCIYEYMRQLHDETKRHFLRCYLRKTPPFANVQSMTNAELLWQAAERVVANDPEKLARVRVAHLPLLFVWLDNWQKLRHEAWEKNLSWPLPKSRKAVADEFAKIAEGVPGKDWTKVNVISEGGKTVAQFLADFQKDEPDFGAQPPKRLWNPRAPADLPHPHRVVDLQDNTATLYKPGQFSEIRYDKDASDLRAVWMPSTHKEWAYRVSGANLPKRAKHGKWDVYVIARVEKANNCPEDAPLFSAGIYGNSKKEYVATITPTARDAGSSYKSFLIGTYKSGPDRDIWIAPSGDKNIKAIYIDRIYMVPSSK
jgi:hypothetical protein